MIDLQQAQKTSRLGTSHFAAMLLVVVATPTAITAEPCGAAGNPGEFYGCTSTEPPCIGLASGSYWSASGTTAYQHSCTGIQTQHDGALCVGVGTTSRSGATSFSDVCDGVLIFMPPSTERVACLGDSSASGASANGTTRTCDRPIPPTAESIAADVALVVDVATGEQDPTTLLP